MAVPNMKKNKMELDVSKNEKIENISETPLSIDFSNTKNDEFLNALKEFRKNLE